MFEWMDQYALGVESMDRGHKEIMRLAATLGSAVADNACREELLEKLDAAIEAAREHMSEEETLLKEAGYPSYKFHQDEHHDLLRTLLEFRAKVADGSATVSMRELEFLAGWMASRLRCEDRRAAEFLTQTANAP